MAEQAYCVALFPSMADVLRAEKLLKKLGVKTKLIPVPRHLSFDCGVCLRFECKQEEEVRSALTTGESRLEGIFRLET